MAHSYCRNMVISYVLRLRSDALDEGSFSGELEAVTTRERIAVSSFEQIADFIFATAASQVRAGEDARRRDRDAG